jgi:cobalt-precorrin 5A hydrolase
MVGEQALNAFGADSDPGAHEASSRANAQATPMGAKVPMDVAVGVGCRAGCDAGVVEALIRDALRLVPHATVRALFTIAGKAGEGGLVEAARRLSLDLVPLPPEALREQTPRVRTCSPASGARFGVPSVSEASALAGAGAGAVLLVARIARDGATCAVAWGPDLAADVACPGGPLRRSSSGRSQPGA